MKVSEQIALARRQLARAPLDLEYAWWRIDAVDLRHLRRAIGRSNNLLGLPLLVEANPDLVGTGPHLLVLDVDAEDTTMPIWVG